MVKMAEEPLPVTNATPPCCEQKKKRKKKKREREQKRGTGKGEKKEKEDKNVRVSAGRLFVKNKKK